MNDIELSEAVERILGFNPVDMFGIHWAVDWRVSGAMLEKVHDRPEPYKWINVMRDIRRIPLGDPLERPIIEACVEALSD